MSITLIIVIIAFVGLLAFSRRNKQRQAVTAARRADAMTVGTQVMTTSGLYGTIVVRNDDDETVQLSIAPGVEVKWSMAALRDMASLPDQFRAPIAQPDSGAAPSGPYLPADDTITGSPRVSFDKSDGDARRSDSEGS